MWKIEIENETAVIESKYHPLLPDEFKKLGGKWNPSAKVWKIPARYKDLAEKVLCEILGKNEDPRVILRIDLSKVDVGNEFWVSAYSVRRPWRDSKVYMSENVAIISGGFPGSGGSRNHPMLEPQPGTIVEFREVPLNIAEKFKAEYQEAVEIILVSGG